MADQFVVKGWHNGIHYAVQVGVDPSRANDGVVAGDPRIIGLLQSYEGDVVTLGPGRRSLTGTTDNPDWVLACLRKYTTVKDVDPINGGTVPDLRVVRKRKPTGAVY